MEFDHVRFEEFCKRGFCAGIGNPGGQVCIEAAIALCAGEKFSDEPTCVHPVIRAHAIWLNDSHRWSSSEARAEGMREYALAQLGTQNIDGVKFAKRLAFLTITKLLPKLFRLLGHVAFADSCEGASDLETARKCALQARDGLRSAAAYAAAAADAAAASAAYADAAAAAADASAAYAAESFLVLGAKLATQVIKELMAE